MIKQSSEISQQDIIDFKNGNHYRLFNILGSREVEIDGSDKVFFAVWAPNVKRAGVIGDFNGWNRCSSNLTLREDNSGIWEGFISGITTDALYKFVFEDESGNIWEKADPLAKFSELPPKTASIFWNKPFEWTDEIFLKNRADKNSLDQALSVYELHLGSWKRHHDGRFYSYKEIAETLIPYIKELGFTHVEFMPIMEFPYDPSWGYQITGYFSPTSRFGNPNDLKHLINELHKANIGVILDWVPSHFPEDAHGLAKFDGNCLYEHADPQKGYHPDWKSLIFDYGKPEVQSFLISNALYWIEEFHVDALRVDAVASMLYLDYSRNQGEWQPNIYGGNENLEAIEFLKKLNKIIHNIHPDVLTIAEESTAFSGVTRKVEDGGLGFSLKWMMGWMNDTLRYFQKDPIHRSYHQNDITFSTNYAFSERFALPFSHDEVVYGKGAMIQKMPGDDWQKFANLRVLYAYMYLHPGAKLLFMGNEFAQEKEWNFDGQLSWNDLQKPNNKGIFRLIHSLNQTYKRQEALHSKQYSSEGFQWIDISDSKNSVIVLARYGNEKEFVIGVCNFTPNSHQEYRIGIPNNPKNIEVLLNTDDVIYGGNGQFENTNLMIENIPFHGQNQSVNLSIQGLSALILKVRIH